MAFLQVSVLGAFTIFLTFSMDIYKNQVIRGDYIDVAFYVNVFVIVVVIEFTIGVAFVRQIFT